jgi:hypothetical protein
METALVPVKKPSLLWGIFKDYALRPTTMGLNFAKHTHTHWALSVVLPAQALPDSASHTPPRSLCAHVSPPGTPLPPQKFK